MKKQLNIDLIQNELRGGSAFFPGYKGGQSPTSEAPKLKESTKADHEPKIATQEQSATKLSKPEKQPIRTPITQEMPPPLPNPHIPERANAPTPER
jgi:hypothetical protein